MTEHEMFREALLRIADIARAATNDVEDGREQLEGPEEAVCTPKALPKDLQVRAAQTATDMNPMNAPLLGFMPDERLALAIMDPFHIAVLTSKYWGPTRRRLTVSFMETTPADLRNRIIGHLNAWSIGIEFVHTTGVGQVRISREGGGYWSYLGTDVLHIATTRPTMNLQGFTMSTPESEFRRVVRHEAGHTLGFPHEHMRREIVARIDREKAYAYFLRTQGWNRTMVDQQVLTPLEQQSIFATNPADQTSIMCYQLPGAITKDGRPILGGTDINATDGAFARRIYPPLVGGAPMQQDVELMTVADVPKEAAEFVPEPVFVD